VWCFHRGVRLAFQDQLCGSASSTQGCGLHSKASACPSMVARLRSLSLYTQDTCHGQEGGASEPRVARTCTAQAGTGPCREAGTGPRRGYGLCRLCASCRPKRLPAAAPCVVPRLPLLPVASSQSSLQPLSPCAVPLVLGRGATESGTGTECCWGGVLRRPTSLACSLVSSLQPSI
jgi:hypothetical protein